MIPSYWQKQPSTKALWSDIEWNRPEQRSQAGRLTIVGGNLHGFAAVAQAYQEAIDCGAGQVRAVLPDGLKKMVPPTVGDAVFVPANKSGGMSRDGQDVVVAALDWADHGLLIGDAGRNSETAIIYEKLLASGRPLTITRDAIDLLRPAANQLLERPDTTLVMSFAQLQKLLQAAYYPRMLSFSMPLMQLVESLHKVSLTYPVNLVTFHQGQLILARDGQVVTTELDNPMVIWRGSVATRAACYQLWSPRKPLEAIATSFVLPS